MTVVSHPDEDYSTLHVINVDGFELQYVSYLSATCEDRPVIGLYQIWQLNEGVPFSVFSYSLCEDVTFAEVLRDSEDSLYLWQTGDCANSPTFTWQDGRYRANDVSCYIVTPAYDEPTSQVKTDITYLLNALESKSPFLRFMENIENSLQRDFSLIAEEDIPRGRYAYALALEALNRPDEALAQYITIYESDPESAWGQLARLHLEAAE
ncbi:MAG: tetratricopeptide repeat protein [Chloroflexota bacterium]